LADPVEEAGLGTAEDPSEDIAADPVEVEADESAEDEAGDADGDGEEVEAEASGKDVVRYSRFKSVNDRRKAAEAKAAALEAEVARLRPKEDKPQPKGIKERLKADYKPAPADLSALEQMQYYGVQALEQHLPEMLDQWFETKFGTKPEAAAATLAHSAVSTREQIIRQFTEAAESHGLNPKDDGLRSAVGVLMDTGKFKTFNEALDVFKAAGVKVQQKTKPVNGKGAEVEGVDLSGLVRVRNPIITTEQAMSLAAKGQRVEQRSVTEILRSALKSA